MTDDGACPWRCRISDRGDVRAQPRRRHDHVRSRIRRRLRGGVGLLRRSPSRAPSPTPTRPSSRWARASWAPTHASASAAWRSAPSSTPPARSAGWRSAPLRVSFADERPAPLRVVASHGHRELRLATRERVLVVVPELHDDEQAERLAADLHAAGIDRRHELVKVGTRRRRARAARPPSTAGAVDGAPGRGRSCAVPGRRRRRCAGGVPSRWVTGSMADRLERLLNLTATLLDTRRPLTLDELAERVEPRYPEDKTRAPAGNSTRQGDAAQARRADHGRIGRRHRRRPGVPHRPEGVLPAGAVALQDPSSPLSPRGSARCGSKGERVGKGSPSSAGCRGRASPRPWPRSR